MRKLQLTLFLFIISFFSLAQNGNRPMNGITIGYFNDRFGSHGLRTGYEYSFYEKNRTGYNQPNVSHAFLVKINVSFFKHPRADVSFVLNVTCGYRYTSKSGIIIEPLHIGTGGMYSFLDGKTFQVDDNGNVTNKTTGYTTFVLPYVQILGIGYDFRQKLNLPFSLSASLDGYSQRYVNSKSWFRLATPISFTLFLK